MTEKGICQYCGAETEFKRNQLSGYAVGYNIDCSKEIKYLYTTFYACHARDCLEKAERRRKYIKEDGAAAVARWPGPGQMDKWDPDAVIRDPDVIEEILRHNRMFSYKVRYPTTLSHLREIP